MRNCCTDNNNNKIECQISNLRTNHLRTITSSLNNPHFNYPKSMMLETKTIRMQPMWRRINRRFLRRRSRNHSPSHLNNLSALTLCRRTLMMMWQLKNWWITRRMGRWRRMWGVWRRRWWRTSRMCRMEMAMSSSTFMRRWTPF